MEPRTRSGWHGTSEEGVDLDVIAARGGRIGGLHAIVEFRGGRHEQDADRKRENLDADGGFVSESTAATTLARSLERVREITLEVLGPHDVRVYLFGSCVTGRVRRSSDIDVAIDPVHPLPSALLAELRERLEESDVPYDVDVVDLSAAGPEIRARVEREGVLWKG